MGGCFAGLTASEYNDWRKATELQSEEKALVLPLISRSSHRRILDLGCGTGLWSRLVAEVHPESSVVGVDVSPDMIACAQKLSEPRLSYAVADCSHPRKFGTFDLIICGMSADYIGFPNIVRTIANSLAAFGWAYIWVLDPSGYEIRQNECVKRWTFGDRKLFATASVFDPGQVRTQCAEVGLRVKEDGRDFRLNDGKRRTLLAYIISRAS